MEETEALREKFLYLLCIRRRAPHNLAVLLACGNDFIQRLLQPRMILEIADCQSRINLEFEVDSQLDVENSVHKLDTLIEALAEFRAGLLEEVDLYRVRESEVDRLNRAAA